MKFLAYLDPGSGSIIIQAIIGAIAGIGFFFKDGIKKLFGTIKKPSSRKKSD